MAQSIQVKQLLKTCSEPFILLKRGQDDFDYNLGDDIDIMAKNGLQLVREILYLSFGLISDDLSIRIIQDNKHYHIDYLEDDKIIVRLDIIDTLDIFKDILLENNEYAHLAFRLLEYAKHPQKKQHLEYVKKCII